MTKKPKIMVPSPSDLFVKVNPAEAAAALVSLLREATANSAPGTQKVTLPVDKVLSAVPDAPTGGAARGGSCWRAVADALEKTGWLITYNESPPGQSGRDTIEFSAF